MISIKFWMSLSPENIIIVKAFTLNYVKFQYNLKLYVLPNIITTSKSLLPEILNNLCF